ncbi:hypothetical protein EHO59_05270 [Leptospira semungkisensis]|uniref:Polyketide cyclase n=1 Tax=Leptospira semungkisensis TaxID=2484985 RepID=A0A4R9G7I2_9LEPT|nr:SRPBCC family protein [Leptospira semungkisensis]TGK07514.1 hypothetical protein EHO59_05270 [Leptospira semungkisensis]
MKIFLRILLGIVLVLGLIGIFAPKEFSLQRDITINKPKNIVFDELKLLRNHDKWSAWSKKDPNMKKEFVGTDGTVGFTSRWESKNEELGVGEQEIKKIVEGERLETEIRFKVPFEAAFSSYLTTDSVGTNQTKVTLGMHDEMPFPINIVGFIVNVCFDNKAKIIKDFDATLAGLKAELEK